MKNNGSHGILIVSEQMAVVSFWAIVKLQKSFAIATYLMGARGCTRQERRARPKVLILR